MDVRMLTAVMSGELMAMGVQVLVERLALMSIMERVVASLSLWFVG